MWVNAFDQWDKSHTPLTRYFVEKIKQLVDCEEVISNHHRTTNGFTLIEEIMQLCNQSLKRRKTIKRLENILVEANDNKLRSSIKNDYILSRYYPDIISYYKKFNGTKLSNSEKTIKDILTKSKINVIRLKSSYFDKIKDELLKIDYNTDTEFNRTSDLIDKLLDCLIPYLLYIGYSNQSISDIAFRQIKRKSGKECIKRFLNLFNHEQKKCKILIKILKNKEGSNEIINYVNSKKYENIKVTKEDIEKYAPYGGINLKEKTEEIYEIKHTILDPHNFIRNLYTKSIRSFVTSKDRVSLHSFTYFFENVYWRFDTGLHKYSKSNHNYDPINVPKRQSTLIKTLNTLSKNNVRKNSSFLPRIKQIEEPVYYYNMALGSKSIENSLFLLWTSLETLIPYGYADSEVENIQSYLSKTLSVGSVGRQILSFVLRLIRTSEVNNNSLNKIYTDINKEFDKYQTEGIIQWINWLKSDFDETDNTFSDIKQNSELLAKDFYLLNYILSGKSKTDSIIKYWKEKIHKSSIAIRHQIDRIYLHRNQIVHTGKFINEYSNLWFHLEWYVGKLLAYAYLKYNELENKDRFNKEDIYMELEARSDEVFNIIELYEKKYIKDCEDLYSTIFHDTWQFF